MLFVARQYLPKPKTKDLADHVEALLGAIYEDSQSNAITDAVFKRWFEPFGLFTSMETKQSWCPWWVHHVIKSLEPFTNDMALHMQ